MDDSKTVKILDHGYVKFIDSMGTDETIVEAARMSTGKGFISWDPYERCDGCGEVRFPSQEQKRGGIIMPGCSNHKFVNYPDGDRGLLDNLWRNKHATPFEMVEFAFEVQAPIMVFREWHRHRTQSFNEFSARYAQMPNIHYVPEEGRFQKQSTHNKQGSAEQVEDGLARQLREFIETEQGAIYQNYEGMVNKGLAKEVARLNTPVSRYSKMRVKTDLRNWLAFCNLRMRPGAQLEIRLYANVVLDFIRQVCPRAVELFEEYDLYGCYLSRKELFMLRGIIGQFYSATCELEQARDPSAMIDFAPMTVDLQKYAEQSAKDFHLSGTKLKEFLKKLTEGGKTIL